MTLRQPTVILSIALTIAAYGDNIGSIIPRHSLTLEGYESRTAIEQRLDTQPLDHVEGIWLMTSSQAVVAIEKCNDPAIVSPGMTVYQATVVTAPRKSVRPGSVLGYFVPAAGKGSYDGWFYTQSLRAVIQNSRPFKLKLEDDSHLTLKAVKSGWRLGLGHTFRFLFRASVYNYSDDTAPDDGFLRLYPAGYETTPLGPIYL